MYGVERRLWPSYSGFINLYIFLFFIAGNELFITNRLYIRFLWNVFTHITKLILDNKL